MNISRFLARQLAPNLLEDLQKNHPPEDFYFLEINVYGNGYIYHWTRINGSDEFQLEIWEKSIREPQILNKLNG